MSASRDQQNLSALTVLLGRKPPPPGKPQAMQVAAPAAGGGGGGRPIDWPSPGGNHTLFAESDDGSVRVVLQDTCGAQVLIRIDAAGAAKVRVIGCDGSGYALTPDGLKQVQVTDPGGEDEAETETGSPYAPITVQACVNGTTRTLHLLGWVE